MVMKRLSLFCLMLLGMLIVYPSYGYAEKRPSELDLKALRKKALKGDAEAQYWMGRTYLEGRLDCDKDTLLAVKWLELSANNGKDWAQYCLAKMYYNGLGVETDRMKAIKWYKQCATYLDYDIGPESKLIYAEALGNGIYGEHKDVKGAIEIASKATPFSTGNLWDLTYRDELKLLLRQYLLLGELYYDLGSSTNNLEEKVDSFKQSLEHFKKVVEVLDSKPFGWRWSFKEEDDDVDDKYLSESYYGWGNALFLININTNQSDYTETMNAYQKAIEYGSEAAMYIVGDMLFSGIENIPANKAEAISLFTRLVGKDIRATYRLATYYYTDKIDYPIAFKYYKAIAEDSSEIDNSVRADALQHLSRMYLFGRGVEVDNDLADKYAQQAVKYGDISSSAISDFLKQTLLSSNSVNMAQ